MRYRNLVMDSDRWLGFELRAGDIVISTPPKAGTTWTQMLCALLIFDGPEFPAPLDQVSPWLDMSTRSIEDVRAALAAQQHRRFIKTHTPLDGLPLRDEVTYVVVGRDPRDVAISWEHHLANVQFETLLELRAAAVGVDDLAEMMQTFLPPEPPSDDPAERLRAFVRQEDGVSLERVLHHLDTAWQRRTAPNIVMFHYSDYLNDLPRELRRLAVALQIDLSDQRASELAAEASIERMRERTDQVVPNASQHGFWKNARDFLRAGSCGEWKDRMDEADSVAYLQRVASLVEPDLAAWSHLGRVVSGVEPGGIHAL